MRELDKVLAEGASQINDIVPGMLKKKIAAFVFLPWLSQYTQKVRDVAKAEERQDILAMPNLPEDARKEIEARGEPPWRE